jgi:hypothetical protein
VEVLDAIIIMGFVMAIVEAVKAFIPAAAKEKSKVLWPFGIVFLAVGLNLLNVYIFGDTSGEWLKLAARDGILMAVGTSGIYSLGKAAVEGGQAFAQKKQG